MKPPPRPQSPLGSLAGALTGLGLSKLDKLEEVDSAKADKILLIKPFLRLAKHFDLKVDLLIYDRSLGTVGLVYELRGKGATIDKDVKSRIDQATYVRHLLLNDRELGDRLPLTVELTFVARHDHRMPFENAMSHVARETRSFLDAVGVSLLVVRETDPYFSPADLRRAFPWLLQATRSWYADPQRQTRTEEPGKPLEAVELVNYRLPGRRILDLHPVPVHLVFGQNGSGKSALVEALELTVTGKAERLEGVEDYSSVICSRNADASTRARVILRYGDKSERTYEVGPAKGISGALNPGLLAPGFRLDQVVMDNLARKGDVDRAKVFLDSFFPGEHKSLREFQASSEQAEDALNRLLPSLRDQLTTESSESEDRSEEILRRLAWLEEEQNRIPPAMAAACLPLSPEHLKELGRLSPELARLIEIWSQAPTVAGAPALLGQIDEALKNVLRPLETLRNAREGLQRIEKWTATGRGRDGGPVDINRWLQQRALADLAEQYCQLLESLSEAHRGGWRPDPDALGPFAEPPAEASYLAELREQATKWAEERDNLFLRVMTPTPSMEEKEPPPAVTPRISRVQKSSLNEAGRWLLPPSTEPARSQLLGDAIEQALKEDTPVQASDLAIGTGDWAQSLLVRLARLEEAVQALQKANSSASESFTTLKETKDAYEALRKAGAKIKKSLVRQLQGEPGAQGGLLIDALNELMALFTPARWAYEDVRLEYQSESALEVLGFRIGKDVQADLRLNTAQLNLFTVALFLLCAAGVDNELRLMVLDDPLQNMDELTVTTLARGLAKVSRLWKEGWRLLLLFHGQEDCARFCQEIPLALHRLPWLSQGEEASKEPDPVLYAGGLQSLTQVARTAPKA